MDTGVIVALVVSISSAVGVIINTLHINKCHSCCMDSDCRKSPPQTPTLINEQKIKNTNTILI
jgi:hypothetical protein